MGMYEDATSEKLLKVLKGNQSAINYHKGVMQELIETIEIIENHNKQIKEELKKRGIE